MAGADHSGFDLEANRSAELDEYEQRKLQHGARASGLTFRRHPWLKKVSLEGSVKGSREDKEDFVKKYLPEHEEIAGWSDRVSYSSNKRKRWQIIQILEQMAKDKELLEEMSEESYQVNVSGLHDPNETRERPLQQPPKKGSMFFSNAGEDGPRVFFGKSKRNSFLPLDKSVQYPDHSSSLELTFERPSKKKSNPRFSLFTVHKYKTNISRKDTHLANTDDMENDEEYSPFDCDDQPEADDSNLIDKPKKTFTMADFLLCQKKTTVNSAKQNVAPGYSLSKSFKGKCFLDENPLLYSAFLDQPNNDEEFENLIDLSEEELQEKSGCILFLDNLELDPKYLKDWLLLESKTIPKFITLINLTLDVMVIIKVDLSLVQENKQHECLLTLQPLGNSEGMDLSSIMDLFAAATCIDEICHLLQEFLPAKKTCRPNMKVMDGYQVMKEDQAMYHICDSHIVATNEPFNYTAMPVVDRDLFCCVCYSEEDLIVNTLCEHTFCTACLRIWLVHKVKGASHATMICPGHECSVLVDVSTLTWILPKHLLEDYLKKELQSHLSSNPFLCVCSLGNLCRAVVQILDPSVKDVTCICASTFCIECKHSTHRPASCKDMKNYFAYHEKIKDYKQKETVVQVRSCPKCQTRWEKTYGCNHMSCSVCFTSFCWGCGGFGKTHQMSYCGKNNVPLEKVHLLPEPTEEFTKTQIKSYKLASKLMSSKNGHLQARLHKMIRIGPSKDIHTALVHSCLVWMDKQNYVDHLLPDGSLKPNAIVSEIKSVIYPAMTAVSRARHHVAMMMIATTNSQRQEKLESIFSKILALEEILTITSGDTEQHPEGGRWKKDNRKAALDIVRHRTQVICKMMGWKKTNIIAPDTSTSTN